MFSKLVSNMELATYSKGYSILLKGFVSEGYTHCGTPCILYELQGVQEKNATFQNDTRLYFYITEIT